MSCYPELTLAIYADGELSVDETAQVSQHLERCGDCRARVAELQEECGVLRESLQQEAHAPALAPRVQPQASAQPSWTWLALGVAAVPVLVGVALAALPTLPPALSWLQDLSWSGGLAVLLRAVSLALLQGEQMITPLVSFAVTVALGLLLLVGAPARRRLLAVAGRGTLVLTLLALSTSALALEQRSSEERVEVAANEQVGESLLMVARYVVVDGVVDGDVFAFARSVTVRGEIKGNLFAAAETVEVKGHIVGSLHAGAQSVTLEGLVDGGAYLAGQTVVLGSAARVQRDLVLACDHAELGGEVGGSLHLAANRVYLDGAVARDLSGATERLEIADKGRVGGDVTIKAPSEQALQVAAGASIAGQKKVEVEPWQEEKRHPLLTADTYLRMLGKTIALLIIGLLVVALLPGGVPRLPAGSGGLLRSAGVGFLVLVATPVVIALAAVTLVGIPLAIATAVLYGFGIFLSTLVVASFAVRALVATRPGQGGRLLLGTAIAVFLLQLLSELPYVGFGLGFLVVILGLGSLALHGLQWFQDRRQPA